MKRVEPAAAEDRRVIQRRPPVAPARDVPPPSADRDTLGAEQILPLQRSAGNAAVVALLRARSTPPARRVVIQRMFLPVEEVAEEEREAALAGYARLLAERAPSVRSLAAKVPEPDPELADFNRAMEIFGRAREKDNTDVAWKALSFMVTNANALEAKARSAGAEVAPTPSALAESDVSAIWDTIRADFPTAEKLCRALAVEQTYLPQVFDAQVVDRARAGMIEIAEQLPRYLSGEDNIVVDVNRTLDSSGTVLQNAGRGALDKATMTVTKSWADQKPYKRLAALVHEASHGAATQTSDQAYLGTWSFDALEPEQQLTNAPHYEAVAEMALGLRRHTSKALASNVGPHHESKLRLLLGRADTWLTKRRLRTGRVIRVLNESRVGPKAVAPTGEDVEPVLVIGQALQLPYAPRSGRPGYIGATNLDTELFGLFRSWLETIHRTLTNLERLEVTKADDVTLSGDRASLTVPYTWVQATDNDVELFLESLARCLPTVAGWALDALVTAMKSLPPR